jgi:asparagine synthase (glutamine-hydrolysing)
MCGICGIFNFEISNQFDPGMLQEMCGVLYHRGPDDEGYYTNKNIGLGMRRLSIIDLESGNQPISNEDKSIWIVFNGEIYNYKELKKELLNKGHFFSTRSDTETIVHAYEEYGNDCVTRLNGMFAFALWDQKRNLLLLARDRLGKKPLYYYFNGRSLIFASEIKSLLKSGMIEPCLDVEALDLFLTFEYIPAPWSIFKKIRKLLPGHILEVKDSKCTATSYWDLTMENSQHAYEKPEIRLIELLEDSVRLRMISDVPLGIFLSGGVDSSAILAMMSRHSSMPIKTFSIGFDDDSYNELKHARLVAKMFNTDHHEEIIKPDVVKWIENLIYFLDEPLGDTSIFPTYLVSRLARKDVKVVLSGDGGDEIFAGYETYIANKVDRIYSRIPKFLMEDLVKKTIKILPPSSKKKGILNKTKRFLEGSTLPEHMQHVRWMIYLSEEEKRVLYNKEFRNSLHNTNSYGWLEHYFDRVSSVEPLKQQQYVDIKTFLADDILVKVDRMSMANSLETRAPLLDYRLVEFAAELSPSLKLRGLKSKYIFKKALREYLPKSILLRKKEGFSSPIKNWLRKDLKPMMMDVLSSSIVRQRGYFNSSYVERLINEHAAGKENHAHRLWPLMLFELWHHNYLN